MGLDINSFVNSVFRKYRPDYPNDPADRPIDLPNEATVGHADRLGVCMINTTYSNDLFVKADANHDNKLSRTELADFVKKFDTNGNGQLDDRSWLAKLFHIGAPSELERFERQYHEVTTREDCN